MFAASIEHQLCTLGFRLASLTSRFDAAQEDLPSTGHLENLLHEIEQLYDDLLAQHQDCSCLYTGQVNGYWYPLTEQTERDRTLQCVVQMAMQLECHKMIDSLMSETGSAYGISAMRGSSRAIFDAQELSRLRYNINIFQRPY